MVVECQTEQVQAAGGNLLDIPRPVVEVLPLAIEIEVLPNPVVLDAHRILVSVRLTIK